MLYPFKKSKILPIILSLLHPCFPSSYFQCIEEELEMDSDTTSTSNCPTPEIVNNHLPQVYCSHSQTYVTRINPYMNVECATPRKTLKSVCLRCAVCLVISQQIEDALKGIGHLDPNKEIEDIKHILISVCKNGFYEYDLRNYKGRTILMKVSSSTTHVSSNMDGRWQSTGDGTFRDCSNIDFKQDPYDDENYSYCHQFGIPNLSSLFNGA